MADQELVITHISERDGYRIIDKQLPDEFLSNPKVNPGQTVRWQAPAGMDVYIAFLAESPFIRRGEPVINEVLEVLGGDTSEELQMAELDPEEVYEYAVLVKEKNNKREYIYVRGAASPPGIVVGP